MTEGVFVLVVENVSGMWYNKKIKAFIATIRSSEEI